MSCCGQNKRPYVAIRASGVAPKPPSNVLFEYTGPTAMAVIGPVSGIRYCFPSPGARVQADPRDSRSLAAIPNLRQI
jgi:hypothetical protein